MSMPYVRVSSQEFGRRIKMQRAIHDLSQRDLARKIGMAQSNLARIESGEAKKLESLVYRFARAFDIDPEVLISKQSDIDIPVTPEPQAKVEIVPAVEKTYRICDSGINGIPAHCIAKGDETDPENIVDNRLYILQISQDYYIVRRLLRNPITDGLIAVADDLSLPIIWEPEKLIVARLTSYTVTL